MPQSPIGGLSFIINVLIILLGALVNLFKRKPINQCLVSQQQILKLEQKKFGLVAMRIAAFTIPLTIFAILASASTVTLVNLYYDTRKITIFDVAKDSYVISKKVANMVVAKTYYSKERGFDLFSFQRVQAEEISAPLKIGSMVVLDKATGTFLSNEVEDFKDKFSKDGDASLIPKGFLFKNAQNEKDLIDFLKSNSFPSTFEVREKLASLFGIKAYKGTERQNNLLRKKLGEFTGNQPEGVIN